jgi:hypothetical protein
MLIFLDTEFTDFTNCELISIGLVSEDGKYEFYAERTDFNYDWCNDFVRSEIWNHLGRYPEAKVKKHQLAQRLRDWLARLSNELTIAFDSQIDWDLMLVALEGAVPENIKGIHGLGSIIDDPVFSKAVDEYHRNGAHPYHHALHDARATRLGWLALNIQSNFNH